ncbi:MAG: HDOD domain-containing protein [Deltaproteobacteria bacterium]|nr:HDOD domain-containing protein [Deltaproteobacteria bacterium]
MIRQETLLREVRALPTLSPSVARLQQVLRDPRSDARAVEAALRLDPAMTGNVLRLANSAAVGLRRKVGDVREAATLLGTKAVFELATQASFAGVIPDVLPGYQIDARAYWLHCAGVAVISEELARVVRPAPAYLHTASLLHDVGKLVASLHLADRDVEIRRALADRTLAEAEVELLGMDHAELGAAVAAHWQLPDEIAAAIRWHHAPDRASEAAQRLTDLVHLADGLAHSLGMGADVGELQRTIQSSAVQRLGIDVRHLELVAAASLGRVMELQDTFTPAGGRR